MSLDQTVRAVQWQRDISGLPQHPELKPIQDIFETGFGQNLLFWAGAVTCNLPVSPPFPEDHNYFETLRSLESLRPGVNQAALETLGHVTHLHPEQAVKQELAEIRSDASFMFQQQFRKPVKSDELAVMADYILEEWHAAS